MNLDQLFPCVPASVGAARDAVNEMSDRLHPDRFADLRLLVSELMTNSVEHGLRNGGTPIGLHLSTSSGSVRAQVRNGGDGFTPPPPSPPSLEAASGRGLYLVDQLADRWGMTDAPSPSVWVELDRPLDLAVRGRDLLGFTTKAVETVTGGRRAG